MLRVAAWCVALLIVYCGAIALWRPTIDTAPSQWNMNRIKAERYLYAPRQPAAIIVGSSLTFNLPQDVLGDDIFNLAFAALGPASGLDLLERCGPPPPAVIIETNFITGDPNDELLSALFFPPLYQLRKEVRGLRYEYQPINLILSLMRMWSGHRSELHRDPPPQVLTTMLPVHEQTFATAPDDQEMQAAIGRVARFAAFAARNGSTIIFLDMPVHPAIRASVRAAAIRRALQAAFPPSAYRWLDPGAGGDYQTVDGLHLTQHDAARVATLLRNTVVANRRAAPACIMP